MYVNIFPHKHWNINDEIFVYRSQEHLNDIRHSKGGSVGTLIWSTNATCGGTGRGGKSFHARACTPTPLLQYALGSIFFSVLSWWYTAARLIACFVCAHKKKREKEFKIDVNMKRAGRSTKNLSEKWNSFELQICLKSNLSGSWDTSVIKSLYNSWNKP